MTGAETSFIGQLGILNAYRIEFNKVPPNWSQSRDWLDVADI
jgi:hypothetical protein